MKSCGLKGRVKGGGTERGGRKKFDASIGTPPRGKKTVSVGSPLKKKGTEWRTGLQKKKGSCSQLTHQPSVCRRPGVYTKGGENLGVLGGVKRDRGPGRLWSALKGGGLFHDYSVNSPFPAYNTRKVPRTN